MTNFGKCDTCRIRKVKCDEALPNCGSCRKKGRECHYSNTRDSIFVHEQVNSNIKQEGSTAASSTATPEPTHSVVKAGRRINLQLRRSRKAENGVGEYSTLGELKSGRHTTRRTPHSEAILACYASQRGLRLRSCSPQAAMLCPQSQLAAEWSAIFGFEALLLNPLGSWVKSVWSRRGESACLDHASDYALESMRAFRSQDQASVSRACSKGEKALRSLQAAMQSNKRNLDRQNLVMAIMLHCAAEQYVDIASFYYIPHVFGISELLKSCLENGVCNEVIRNVISLICFDEINLSITFDRPSALESVPVPYTPIDGPYDLCLALLASDYLLIKVPRLLSLVRSAVEYPAQDERRLEASRLVRQWYKSTANTYIEKTLERHMWTVRNSDGVARSPTEEHFEFDGLSAFGLAVRHYPYRILMCGLMQAVDSLDTESIDRDIIAAQEEDIAAATSLAMCLDYALKPTNAMPMTALGALMPLQAAYAAWYRLEKRQVSNDTEEHRLAIRMKDWSLDSIHSLEAVWCDRSSRRERMEEYAEMVSGGKAFERAYNYKRLRAGSPHTSDMADNAEKAEYQWVLDLSAGLEHLELSNANDHPIEAGPFCEQNPRSRVRKTNETVDTSSMSWCVEASPSTRRALVAPGASAPAFGRDPADPKALMKAWGYSGRTFEHFRQS